MEVVLIDIHKCTTTHSPSLETASEIRSHIDLCIDAGPGGLYGRPFDSEAGPHRNVESARRCAFSSSAVRLRDLAARWRQDREKITHVCSDEPDEIRTETQGQ